MKYCSKCKQTKNESEFYKEAKSKDGLRSDCKACKETTTINWRRANQEKNRVQQNIRVEKYNKNHPERPKARVTANNAVRDGKIEQQPCEVIDCTEKAEKHHEDYSKPLDVRWLCKKHHTLLHRKEQNESIK